MTSTRMISSKERVLLDNLKLVELELREHATEELVAIRARLVTLLTEEIDKNNLLLKKVA